MIIQIILGAVVILVLFVLRKLSNQKLSNKIPGRSPLAAIFNLATFRNDIVNAANLQEKWFRWSIIGQEALIAIHPDSIKFVLSNPDNFIKVKIPSLSKEQDRLFDGHMLSSNGETWHRHRDATKAAFHWDAVKGLAEPFYGKTIELLKIWAAEGSKPVEVTDILPKFTLDVLGVSVFSYDFQAIYGKENEHFNDYYYIMNFAFKRGNLLRGVMAKIFGLPVIGDLNSACVRMREFCKQIILDKQKQQSNAKDAKTFDIVDMMIHSDAGLTLDEMVSNVFIFFVAGHETTASALSWLLYHLGTHPDVQEKVRAEVTRVLKGNKMSSELMRELPYTALVIKENMRVQAPVTELATRECVQDTEHDGVVIPKGVRIGIAFEAAHMNEKFWDRPTEFIPERFEDSSVKQHPFAWLPFSLKSRACIGSQFSLIEQTVFLTALVQHFKWTVVDVKPATKSVVLNRPDQLRVKFEQIKAF